MKKKAIKNLLLTSLLGLAIFGTVLPVPNQGPDPSEPALTQTPSETEPPTGEEDIIPLSDLEIKDLH
ncbi:MAG: hypothetical protein HFH91_16050 [Lachnospiraceae bacterium]|jgi:hypothetical protein|nr:hypothetical protein [Lachnospiraceae bacterium]